jgi:simple sugar transport system ATP-binding protein
MSVLYISAELEEVLRLSHRILVLRDRRKVADLVNDDLGLDGLLALIAEGAPAAAAAPDPISEPERRA